MAARKHSGPGSLPTRGVAASVVVAVRLTPAEAAALDALGPNRGESIRRLILRAGLDAVGEILRNYEIGLCAASGLPPKRLPA